MSYAKEEVSTGAMVLGSLVLLLVLTFMIGNFFGGGAQAQQIRFGYVNGLEENAPVYYAGREVGKVEKIELNSENPRPVLVSITLQDEIQLRQTSEAFIDTLGMMGEKFVELSPGSLDGAPLAKGSFIEGTDPIPMYLLIQKMKLLADRMEELTSSLNPLMERADNFLKGEEENIAKIIANFEETSRNVRDMTNDLKFRPWRLVRKNS